MRVMIPVSRLSLCRTRFSRALSLEIRGGRRWRALGTLHERIINFASAVCQGLVMCLIQPKIRPRRCDVSCWILTLPDVPFRICLF